MSAPSTVNLGRWYMTSNDQSYWYRIWDDNPRYAQIGLVYASIFLFLGIFVFQDFSTWTSRDSVLEMLGVGDPFFALQEETKNLEMRMAWIEKREFISKDSFSKKPPGGGVDSFSKEPPGGGVEEVRTMLSGVKNEQVMTGLGGLETRVRELETRLRERVVVGGTEQAKQV